MTGVPASLAMPPGDTAEAACTECGAPRNALVDVPGDAGRPV